MNKFQIFSALFLVATVFTSCSKDDDNKDDTNTPVNYGYQITIEEPDTEAKMMGQTLHMEAEYKSTTGKPIYNVRVRVYKKTDKSVVLFDGPSPYAVNDVDGSYYFHEHLDMTTENGFEEHTDYVFQTDVWGLTLGEGLVSKKVEFHVHPM